MRSTNKDNACLHLFKNSIRYQLDDRLQYMSQELVKHYQREQNFLGGSWGGVIGFLFSHVVFADNDSTSIDLVGFGAAWVVLVDDIPARYRLQ